MSSLVSKIERPFKEIYESLFAREASIDEFNEFREFGIQRRGDECVTIPYIPNLGNGYTIPEEDVKHRLKVWFDEAQGSNREISACAIMGEFEFNDINYIMLMLDGRFKCNSLQVVFGGEISSQRRREILKTLLETHEAFEVYNVPERPQSHKILFGDKIMYEDHHSRGDRAERVYVYEYMPEKHISEF